MTAVLSLTVACDGMVYRGIRIHVARLDVSTGNLGFGLWHVYPLVLGSEFGGGFDYVSL